MVQKDRLALATGYAFLCVAAIVDLVPFVWMLLSSLKPQAEIFSFPPSLLPKQPSFRNYAAAWNAGGLNFARMFMNSMIVAIPATALCILSSSLAAFAFARIRFRGRDTLFMCFVAAIMMPTMMVMIPTFLLMRPFIDTFVPLIARVMFGQAFVIFLFRQFFMTIPKELDDAALVDGYSKFRIWWSIIMPLSKPVIATLVVFVFQQVYNDFLYPLIFINSKTNFTVQLGLASFRGIYVTRYDLLMAASVFTLVPILVLFLAAQRYFVEGVVMSGLKG
ncbi:MAG TPA: carbohydrate ABC transporter permease [Rectinemataceae bacterium]|nr:carbohydrate ABC transporter permease [Rectinemataceae bacterium]